MNSPKLTSDSNADSIAEACINSGVDQDFPAESPDQRVSMDNFALIRVLGKGAFGKVFLVRKIGGHDSGLYYAMKVLKKKRVSQKQKSLEHTLAERQVLEQLKGLPFLVNMVYAFQTETKLHIVMEFVRGGELFTYLYQRKCFDIQTTKMILAEVVVALEHVHERNILYRDLKLENILIDEEGHVKLTDFGLSKALQNGISTTNSFCGTMEYMSPEVVGRDGHSKCADWWSVGVIAFMLLTGCSPFTVDGEQNSTEDIAKRILTKWVPFPESIDDTARTFIAALLNKDPGQRLGAKGVEEIKSAAFFEGIDWTAVLQRKQPSPLKPTFFGLTDVRNFAPEFTNQLPIFSPAEKPAFEYQDIFRGYSFIAPSVIFSNDNVIGDECFEETIKFLSQSPFFAKYTIDTSAEGLLGRGTFSVCRKCTRTHDGKEFAVKIVSKRFTHHALREISILELLNPHDQIVHFIEALQDSLHYYIVLELLNGGELLQCLRRIEKFKECQAADIMSQLVAAVSHMHKRNIVHRDLKPENILFENDGPGARLRLVDFGFARILPNSKDSLVTPCIGTLHYAAPEVLEIQNELPEYNQQCDLWSLGVILFTMLSGKVPFHARSQTESAADIISRIRVAEFSFDDPVWEMVSESAKDLITGLLTVDPKKRLSLHQLARHSWLTVASEESLYDLQTPTILPSTADEIVKSKINPFITVNREGFYLMDVYTAPLLIKRRGMKRRSGQQDTYGTGINNGMPPQKTGSGSLANSRKPSALALNSVPEDVEILSASSKLLSVARLTTLEMRSPPAGAAERSAEYTLTSAAFTDSDNNKPPYLKNSRDDVGTN